MLKKILLCLFLTTLINLYSADKDNSLFFYVPTPQEANEYFNLYLYLQDCDSGKIDMPKEWLKQYYPVLISHNTLEGLLLESFLLQTENKKIKKVVKEYIKANKLDDEFSLAVLRKYESSIKFLEVNNKTQKEFNYQDKLFDEDVNLFSLNQIEVFDKKLSVTIFHNNWFPLNNPLSNHKKGCSESFFLLYGGRTNSIKTNFTKYEDVTFEEFHSEEVKNSFTQSMYSNWKIEKLENIGILTNSGFDKNNIYIAHGYTDEEKAPGIQSATFEIYLYNEKLKEGYSVSYFMNISKDNNNYKIRHRVWNSLFMQLSFVLLEDTKT